VDELVALAPELSAHQRLAPVFSGQPVTADDDADETRKEILEELADETVANLVAERDGRIVGNFFVCPLEQSESTHYGLARPERMSFLGFAITSTDVRGAGAGVALTQGAFAWARAQGYEAMVTDWRVTNLLSSRFWPARGFRTTFFRLHRLIA
jgi:GNAT superfamily N-acetyltransferase